MTRLAYGDLPTRTDELGFAPSAEALAAIVQQADHADTPLTIGIYGPWGSGKTSLMQMMQQQFDPGAQHDQGRYPTVWFDAWRYAHQDALWRALLLSVVEALRTLVQHDQRFAAARDDLKSRFDDLTASLYRSVEREERGAIEFQWGKAGMFAADTIIRAGFSYIPLLGQISRAAEKAGEAVGEEAYAERLLDLFQSERTRIYREQVQSLEQFHQGLKHLIDEIIVAFDRRLVIFIDDLDRCLPEQAIQVLEAIKVFLDMPGCIFVLGMDREVIERGIRVRYKEFALAPQLPGAPTAPFPVAERDYLEKIVQVPFSLPPLAPETITTFLRNRLPAVAGLNDAERHAVAQLMTAGLLRNPRKVKRSFNIFRLHLALDRAHGRQTAAGLIAKLTVIQSSFADLYERIARDPVLVRQVERIVRGTPGTSAINQELRDLVGKSDQRLKELLSLAPFFDDASDGVLQELVYQSQVTGAGG